MNTQTDTTIRAAITASPHYLSNCIGRIIHLSEFSIVRYDGCDLRTHYTMWIVFINNKDVADYRTLREAKLHGKKDPRYTLVTA